MLNGNRRKKLEADDFGVLINPDNKVRHTAKSSNFEQCGRTGKRMYDSYTHATGDASNLARNKQTAARGFNMSVYHCRFCQHWHVGSQPKPKKQVRK